MCNVPLLESNSNTNAQAMQNIKLSYVRIKSRSACDMYQMNAKCTAKPAGDDCALQYKKVMLY